MSSIKEGFDRKGFVTISYPKDLRASVLRLANAWKNWCSLPQEKKSMFPYSDGVGYQYQDEPGATRDIKEVFHFTGEKEPWLRDRARDAKSLIAQDLIADSRGVLESLFPMILAYNKGIEEEYGLSGLADEVRASKDRIFIRAIHYFPGKKPGETLAAHHIDKSGQTEHLYEDLPGVEGLGFDGVWRPIPTWQDEMVAFPSLQMQLRSGGKITALCHRVVATNESGENGRYAIVAFTELAKTPKYDKAHIGRLQDLPAGFNYGMDPGEFRKYFA